MIRQDLAHALRHDHSHARLIVDVELARADLTRIVLALRETTERMEQP